MNSTQRIPDLRLSVPEPPVPQNGHTHSYERRDGGQGDPGQHRGRGQAERGGGYRVWGRRRRTGSRRLGPDNPETPVWEPSEVRIIILTGHHSPGYRSPGARGDCVMTPWCPQVPDQSLPHLVCGHRTLDWAPRGGGLGGGQIPSEDWLTLSSSSNLTIIQFPCLATCLMFLASLLVLMSPDSR